MIVNWGSSSKTNLVIINLLLRTHPAQQLFSSLGRIFQLLTIMIAVTNGSEGLFYGKGQHFLQVLTRAVESEFKSNPIFSDFPILSDFLSDFI